MLKLPFVIMTQASFQKAVQLRVKAAFDEFMKRYRISHGDPPYLKYLYDIASDICGKSRRLPAKRKRKVDKNESKTIG